MLYKPGKNNIISNESKDKKMGGGKEKENGG